MQKTGSVGQLQVKGERFLFSQLVNKFPQFYQMSRLHGVDPAMVDNFWYRALTLREIVEKLMCRLAVTYCNSLVLLVRL